MGADIEAYAAGAFSQIRYAPAFKNPKFLRGHFQPIGIYAYGLQAGG
jgi:hypothetical protein